MLVIYVHGCGSEYHSYPNQSAHSVKKYLGLTLYPPRGGEISPPPEKKCFSIADFIGLLKVISETESISELSQTLAMY